MIARRASAWLRHALFVVQALHATTVVSPNIDEVRAMAELLVADSDSDGVSDSDGDDSDSEDDAPGNTQGKHGSRAATLAPDGSVGMLVA